MELSAIKAEFKEKQPAYYAALEKLEVLDQYLTNIQLYFCDGSSLPDEMLPIIFIGEWSLENGFILDLTGEGGTFWWNIFDQCLSIVDPNAKSILDYYAEITKNNGFSLELCEDWSLRLGNRHESLPRMLEAIDKYSDKHKSDIKDIQQFLDILYLNAMLSRL